MREADFVSVGSNDLVQFVFAADRGTPALAERYDVLTPAMLTLLAQVSEAARGNTALSLCGEAASDPLQACVLVALGITRLSMSASSLLAVKATLTALDLRALRPFLASLRRSAGHYANLRAPLAAWARDHDLPI
jgi:phosphotransferase system enzyme I (PtsP)